MKAQVGQKKNSKKYTLMQLIMIHYQVVVPLLKVLNNSMKGLINLKNKDHKCFMWCHDLLILKIKIQKE